MKELMKKMIENAMAYNKTLTQEYLMKLDFNTLLAFTHPLDRSDFVKEGQPWLTSYE